MISAKDASEALWMPQGLEWTKQWREAAILVPCIDQDDKEQVVLTVRSKQVAHHKGQIAFPGGAQDPEDNSAWETATREAEEEIGLASQHVALVKELAIQFTPTQFRIRPFVGKIESLIEWDLNEGEIAELFTVPLDHLRDPAHREFQIKEYNGYRYLDPHFYFKDYDIWGVTGRILCDFLEIQPET